MTDFAHARREPRTARGIGVWLVIALGLVLLTGVGVVVSLVHQREAHISRASYELIDPGMSEAEVRQLLGPPDYTIMQFGLVSPGNWPSEYTINFASPRAELVRRGYDDYRFMQWASPEITIVIICDTRGSVATKYANRGQSTNWHSWLGRVMKLFRTSP